MSAAPPRKPAAPPAPSGQVKLYSNEYFTYCALGGILSCGITHTAMTPVDLVKCNIQANPKQFHNLGQGISLISRTAGLGGLTTGWLPTAYGYSIQGFFKFGLYEYFKYHYAHAWAAKYGEKSSHDYRDLIYLTASASAEFFADIGLAAFEATKVRMQTTLDPTTLKPQTKSMVGAMRNMKAQEGMSTFFKGTPPLWFRQIPYTMMKFFGFERAVELIYSQMSKPKDQYDKLTQLGVSFAGGYLAGIFCATVSHPADTVVSILNKNKGSTIGQVWRTTPKMTLFTKGLGARIIMIGTLTGLQWLIYDSFKTYMKFPTTGGVAPTKAAPTKDPKDKAKH